MGAVKNNLIIDMENEECDDEGSLMDLMESIRLQQDLKRTFFDRQVSHFINLLRRFVCK